MDTLKSLGSFRLKLDPPATAVAAAAQWDIKKRPVTEMPDALFRRIIDQLAERGYQGEIALHFYNEPLLEKRLSDSTCMHIKSALRVSFISQATEIT